MRSPFIKIRLLLLLVAACWMGVARTQAQFGGSGDCGSGIFNTPSSQAFTNTEDGTFSTELYFSANQTIDGNPSSWLTRKGGAGFGDFGVWTLSKSGSGSGGWFTGNSDGNGGGDAGNDIGYSWGLYASGGELVNAVRLLSPTNAVGNTLSGFYTAPLQPLPIGSTFNLDMDNGYVSSGSSVGIGFQNAEGQTLWEWYFAGGGTTYTYHDGSGYNSSSLGWTAGGLHVSFTLTSANTYSATVTYASSSGSFTASGSFISESDNAIVQARAWNYSAGSGSGYDFFVNNLNYCSKSDNANTSTYLSPRSWVSGDGSGWDLHAGSHSGFFMGSSTNTGGGSTQGIDGYGPGPYALTATTNCWGIYANSGDVADAIRPFGQPLYFNSFSAFTSTNYPVYPGTNVVQVTMDNGYVQSGASVGFGLQSGATNRFEFFFKGGNTNYFINDSITSRDTGIPWTDQGLFLEFALTGTNTYRLTVSDANTNGPAGGPWTVTGTLEGVTNSAIDRIRLFNANAGSGSSYDLFFGYLAVGNTAGAPFNDSFWCYPEYDCAHDLKYDQASFGPWGQGVDNGYSELYLYGGVYQNEYYPPYVIYGGAEVAGAWDFVYMPCSSVSTASAPWEVSVVNQ